VCYFMTLSVAKIMQCWWYRDEWTRMEH